MNKIKCFFNIHKFSDENIEEYKLDNKCIHCWKTKIWHLIKIEEDNKNIFKGF